MTAYDFGEFRFVPQARELWRAGRRVELPRRTFECLEFLIAHHDRAVHRDELVDAVFHRPNVSDAQLGQVVLRTRRALDDDGSAQRVIRTIAGYGYRWVAKFDRVVIEGTDRDRAMQPRSYEPADGSDTPVPAAVDGAADEERVAGVHTSRVRQHLRIATLVAGVAVAGTLFALRGLWSGPTQAPVTAMPTASERIVVLPLHVEGLREDAWVRLGAMDLVAERLRESGFGVPPSENVLGLLQASTTSSGEPDPAIVRSSTGARFVVRGNAVRGAAGWKVELSAAPGHGIAVPVEFAAADAMQAARGATDLLLAALGHTSPADHERDDVLEETLRRARAAMLANELDTARSILAASPDLAAAPDRLVYWLAQVDFRAGRLDQVEGALNGLLTRSTTQADPRFRAQVLSARGGTRTRRGEFADGGRDFDAALAALGSDADVLERGKARLGRANSRVAEHRYSDALADFGAARTDLESGGDTLGVARVDANLGMLELYRGRPAAALVYLPGAADRFQAFGAIHELLLTLTGLVEAQLAMLQRDEAWATFERAWALRERITDPDQRVDLLLNRARVLMGNGRYREAQAALVQARGMTTSGNRVLLARRFSLDAELAASLDHWNDAAAAAAAALADWPVAGADADRAAVLLIRQRALLALGQHDAARALLDRVHDVPQGVVEESHAFDKPTSDKSAVGKRAVDQWAVDQPGTVNEALAMAEWQQQAGDASRAAAWFAFAAASADRRGVPAEIVAVAQSQATLLLATGARGEAAAVIGRVAPWATRDYAAALLQVRLFHALDQRDPWFNALRQAQKLSGERAVPPALLSPRESSAQVAPSGVGILSGH